MTKIVSCARCTAIFTEGEGGGRVVRVWGGEGVWRREGVGRGGCVEEGGCGEGRGTLDANHVIGVAFEKQDGRLRQLEEAKQVTVQTMLHQSAHSPEPEDWPGAPRMKVSFCRDQKSQHLDHQTNQIPTGLNLAKSLYNNTLAP